MCICGVVNIFVHNITLKTIFVVCHVCVLGQGIQLNCDSPAWQCLPSRLTSILKSLVDFGQTRRCICVDGVVIRYTNNIMWQAQSVPPGVHHCELVVTHSCYYVWPCGYFRVVSCVVAPGQDMVPCLSVILLYQTLTLSGISQLMAAY